MNPIQAGLATLFASGTSTGLSDTELLERWASRGERMAFEVLVGRHAHLVMNVCRGLLADSNDADDAFQATFLVLARKAGSISAGDSLASWLCRVAYRIAVRAGTEATRRRQAERRGAEQNATRTASAVADRPGTDEVAVLLDELDRLPERYRAPIVLCHLEGLSTDAAARRLGCRVGTIWARLSRARARLRARLVGRGISLSAAALAAGVFPPVTQAAISSELLQTTIRSSLRYLTLDSLTAGVTSARPLAWTDAALRAMLRAKLKAAAMIVLTVGALATVGAGVLAHVLRQTSQPVSPSAGGNEDIRRTIHFPDNRAVGIIYLLDADEHDLSAIRDYDRWQRIGEARGVVRLPARGLVRLDLSRSAVSDLSPLQQLDPRAIRVLHLRDLGARDDALRHISHFKGLLRLDLRGNFFTGRALEHVATMHGLLSLELGDTTIGDDGIRQIAQLKSLRAIGLGRSQITDRSLELLGSMLQLESLDLYQTAITDRGVAHLVGLENLRYLGISNTNTTNLALEHVANLKNLDHLAFDDTRVTDSGLAFLVRLKKLESIRAYRHPFSDAGLAHLAKLPALKELWAGNGTTFTDRGLAHLSQCHSLRILSLGGPDHFTDEGLFHLSKLPRLEDLTISGRASREPRSAPAITDRGMTSLRRIKTLKRLFLSDCRIGGGGLASLSHLPALEALGLAETSLTFEDLRQLAGFHNLKDFRLYTVAADAGRPTLRAFRSLESLEWLRLPDKANARGAGIAVDFEPAEFANLSGLIKMKNLEYTGRLTDAGLKHLAPLTAMDNLDLRNADVTDDGLRYLSHMKDLNDLTIGGRITDEGLRHLAILKSLRVLQLNTRTVSLEGVKWLWEQLPSLVMVPGFDDLAPLIVGQEINYTKVGENAPDFSVTMRDGKEFRLADQRGKVVLVHFWGPKCAPCIRAIPKLKALHQELSRRADRFAMISLTIGMQNRDWQAFLNDHATMDWPQALLGDDQLELWTDFHVRGIPDYSVIGPNGKIIADGESTGRDIDKLRAAIIEAMGNSQAAKR
jgi:RNA polymerase sigma factor (sigma-70 family)